MCFTPEFVPPVNVKIIKSIGESFAIQGPRGLVQNVTLVLVIDLPPVSGWQGIAGELEATRFTRNVYGGIRYFKVGADSDRDVVKPVDIFNHIYTLG